MRTTIEIPDELLAKLAELAARRGEEDLWGLVAEAVAGFVADEGRRAEFVAEAMATLGRLSDEDADALRRSVADARAAWRRS